MYENIPVKNNDAAVASGKYVIGSIDILNQMQLNAVHIDIVLTAASIVVNNNVYYIMLQNHSYQMLHKLLCYKQDKKWFHQ